MPVLDACDVFKVSSQWLARSRKYSANTNEGEKSTKYACYDINLRNKYTANTKDADKRILGKIAYLIHAFDYNCIYTHLCIAPGFVSIWRLCCACVALVVSKRSCEHGCMRPHMS